jgi:hypothetical protein
VDARKRKTTIGASAALTAATGGPTGHDEMGRVATDAEDMGLDVAEGGVTDP